MRGHRPICTSLVTSGRSSLNSGCLAAPQPLHRAAPFIIMERALRSRSRYGGVIVKFKPLLDRWKKDPPPARTAKEYAVRLPLDDASRLHALVELFPGLTVEEIITDLLHAGSTKSPRPCPTSRVRRHFARRSWRSGVRGHRHDAAVRRADAQVSRRASRRDSSAPTARRRRQGSHRQARPGARRGHGARLDAARSRRRYSQRMSSANNQARSLVVAHFFNGVGAGRLRFNFHSISRTHLRHATVMGFFWP